MALRLIQVGLGGCGRHWASSVIPRNKDVELVAYVDTVPEMLDAARAALPPPTTGYFLSLEEALENTDCQAVLISASLAAHVPCTLLSLKAGKHVLLEKPFAPTLAEAQQVVETAARLKRILAIDQNYRFFPAVQKVRELVRTEALGPVESIQVDFRRYANTLAKGSDRHYTIWEPLLVDMSIHHFDLMRYILGQEASRIFCQTWNPSWSNFTEPACGAATITFAGGTIVNYRGSWVSMGPETGWAGEWHIECARGEIVIWSCRDEHVPDRVTIQPLGEKARVLALPSPAFTDWGGSLHAFVEAIRAGQEPEHSGRDNLKTLALTLAAVEAAAHGASVELTAERVAGPVYN